MRTILGKDFFGRPTLTVARDMLGKFLVCRDGRRIKAAMITEVEAYDGSEDRASHASRGQTHRNVPMFGEAGNWYVYLVYGMHWMLNIVTGARGYPAAVLLRGVEGVSGPGRLAREFGADKSFDGRRVSKRAGLWIEDRGVRIPRSRIGRSARIGVDYAGEWASKPYRFYVK